MKLVKVEVNDFNGRGYMKTKLDKIIDEFIAMDTAVAEIEGWEQAYKTAYSCHASLKTALKRRGYNHIIIMTKDGVPYIVNKTLLDKEV